MTTDPSADIAAVQGIAAVPRILEVVCRSTGMGFAAVARVTEQRWVCCAVRDEIAFEPIPAIAMGRLFQPFYRMSGQDCQQGLGLGLYIASEIARAHGGIIDVTSSPQETRFTFRMPL